MLKLQQLASQVAVASPTFMPLLIIKRRPSATISPTALPHTPHTQPPMTQLLELAAVSTTEAEEVIQMFRRLETTLLSSTKELLLSLEGPLLLLPSSLPYLI
jgi:hypothetical protein